MPSGDEPGHSTAHFSLDFSYTASHLTLHKFMLTLPQLLVTYLIIHFKMKKPLQWPSRTNLIFLERFLDFLHVSKQTNVGAQLNNITRLTNTITETIHQIMLLLTEHNQQSSKENSNQHTLWTLAPRLDRVIRHSMSTLREYVWPQIMYDLATNAHAVVNTIQKQSCSHSSPTSSCKHMSDITYFLKPAISVTSWSSNSTYKTNQPIKLNF